MVIGNSICVENTLDNCLGCEVNARHNKIKKSYKDLNVVGKNVYCLWEKDNNSTQKITLTIPY